MDLILNLNLNRKEIINATDKNVLSKIENAIFDKTFNFFNLELESWLKPTTIKTRQWDITFDREFCNIPNPLIMKVKVDRWIKEILGDLVRIRSYSCVNKFSKKQYLIFLNLNCKDFNLIKPITPGDELNQILRDLYYEV